MKIIIFLIVIVIFVIKASADCWSTSLGYPCCSSTKAKVWYTDSDGEWGVENKSWCGIPKPDAKTETCWSLSLGYSCCKKTNTTVYTDSDGNWGVENGAWCGISDAGKTDKNNALCTPDPLPSNPFKANEYFINPYYFDQVEKAVDRMTDESLIKKAEKMKYYSNAIWLDSIENMNKWLERNIKTALLQQQGCKYVLSVFVLYDLPGRNCHSLASNGELLPNDNDMVRYKTEYIDAIEQVLMKYKNQPIVLIIEPNSLADLIAFGDIPACVDAKKYYLEGHAYLIQRLGYFSNVYLYLDIGSSYLMGWEDRRYVAVKLYYEVIKSGSPGKVRGFASNVGKYSPWEDPEVATIDALADHPCPDEKSFIKAMYKDFKSAFISSHFIVDTSHNGCSISDPEKWCNQKDFCIGAEPQANPVPDMDYIDAFYWVKPLGVSDGTSDTTSEHYDEQCGLPSSMKPAPEAGSWFQESFEEGLRNSNIFNE